MDKLINLGKSIQIKGELTGSEDLTIEGKIDGKIVLKDHYLTIGENGHINAEIRARGVTVSGELVGDILADDKVEVSASGSMLGDIRAPRVVLADGARFKGSIDMEPKAAATARESSDKATDPATSSTKASQKRPAADAPAPAAAVARSGHA